MKNLQKTIEQLDHYLHTVYKNYELSKTEIYNFLTAYTDFILLYNKIQPEDYNINIHYVKEFGDCITDFNYKESNKKRKRIRNKENIKKHRHTEYSQTLAYVQIGKDLKNFDIYLNLNKCDFSNKSNIAFTLSNLGHEVEHIIQQFKLIEKSNACTNCYKKKLNSYNSLIAKATNKSYIRKLTQKFHAHADTFALINTIETYADNNSVVYFYELFELIKQNCNRENDYLYFIYDIYIMLELIQKSREKTYKQAIKREKVIKKSLKRDFNIDEDILLIP